MIVNPDHMSQAAVDDTLTLLEARTLLRRDLAARLDGPGQLAAAVEARRRGVPRPLARPTDYVEGVAAVPAASDAVPVRLGLRRRPRRPLAPARRAGAAISYPFKSYDGKVTFERQTTGERTFDYTKEGVAHYGLYADWFEDLRRARRRRHRATTCGTAPRPTSRCGSAPRASAPPAATCHAAGCAVAASGGSILRRHWTRLLQRAGQPQQRGRVWTYCVRGQPQPDARRTSRSSPPRARSSWRAAPPAAATRAGSSSAAARAGCAAWPARSAAGSTCAAPGRRSRFVYYVRKGRVRMVAVATRRLASSRRRLRAAVRRARRARAAQVKRTFVPASTASASLRGGNLAGSTNTRLNRQLALLCGL